MLSHLLELPSIELYKDATPRQQRQYVTFGPGLLIFFLNQLERGSRELLTKDDRVQCLMNSVGTFRFRFLVISFYFRHSLQKMSSSCYSSFSLCGIIMSCCVQSRFVSSVSRRTTASASAPLSSMPRYCVGIGGTVPATNRISDGPSI